MQIDKRIVPFGFFILCSNFAIAQISAREIAIQEIIKAEKDFAAMAVSKGIEEAFWYFADEAAVIKRGNDSLIKGKAGIRHFYSNSVFKKATLAWWPDFVDAGECGDTGYTYGKYLWQLKLENGKLDESRGVFHTVWKKQQDGSWKFVWD